MRKLLLILTSITLASAGGYSQSICNCFTWVDSTFHAVPLTLGNDTGIPPDYGCNECSSHPIKLPFSFCFYGKYYDTVYINNKGTLSFIHPVYNFSSTGFPAGTDTLMLAALWADIDDRAVPGALLYYKITPTHLVVQWYGVGYNTFDDDLFDDFQVTITNGNDPIVPSGNNVEYCYYSMKWQSADSSGGSGGFGGIPAAIGVNKGDHVHYAQFGVFNYHGYNYYGPFAPNSELYWTNYKSFIFNTCVNGNNIPPVIIKPDTCYNDTVCAGDMVSFSAEFICPQKGQKATLTVSSPGLSGLISDTSSVNSIYRISNKLTAHLKDTGTHFITLKATDNGSPPLTDSVQFTVTIKPCGDTATGIKPNETSGSTSTVYPNPNNGRFTIEMKNEKPIMKNIEVYNVLGEKMYSKFSTFNSQVSIDLSNQPGGIYFYRIISVNGNLLGNGKFVIQ